MRNVNKVILIGRLGKDPEKTLTNKGHVLVRFPLGTTRQWHQFDEERGTSVLQKETSWHRVVVWGKQAVHCNQYLKKGQAVYIEGMIKNYTFTQEDGTSKKNTEIHANEVNFLSPSESHSDENLAEGEPDVEQAS